MKLRELVAYLDERLSLAAFAGEASNNGLQVEGNCEVKRAVFGVDGSLALFERAAELGADFVFVHHGLSWGGEPRRLRGYIGKRFETLFCNGISLYAAHLPLDAHSEIGNNAGLAAMAGLKGLEPFCDYHGYKIGFLGEPGAIVTAAMLAEQLGNALNAETKLIADHGCRIRRAAIVSGGGGMDALEQAAEAGADLLITGEMEHVMYHPARELGVPVLALGHYASETVGPRLVMKECRAKFDLHCEFVELPTGL